MKKKALTMINIMHLYTYIAYITVIIFYYKVWYEKLNAKWNKETKLYIWMIFFVLLFYFIEFVRAIPLGDSLHTHSLCLMQNVSNEAK